MRARRKDLERVWEGAEMLPLVEVEASDVGATGAAAELMRQARLIRDAEQVRREDDEAWAAVSDTTGWTA